MRSHRLLGIVLIPAITVACQTQLDRYNPNDPEGPIEQQNRGSISGQVLSIAQVPLEFATMRLTDEFDVTASPQITDDTGRFMFPDLRPGEYLLSIEHGLYFAQLRTIQVSPAEQANVDIVLLALPDTLGDSTGRLTGVLYKASEANLPSGAAQDHSGILVEVLGQGIRTTTNSKGEFDLYLSAGTYDIAISAVDHRLQTISGVLVETGTTIELPGSPIELEPNPGRVSGRLSLEGQSGSQAGVAVALLGGPSTTTDENGNYLLSGVSPGIFSIQFTMTNFEPFAMAGVAVRGGRLTVLPDAQMSLARGSVTGVVERSGDVVLGGTLVELVGTSFAAVTASNGQFLIQGVPVGTYTLRARSVGWLDTDLGLLQVAPNMTNSVGTTVMAPNPGVVRGIVTLEGSADHSDITVGLEPGGLAVSTSQTGAFTFPAVLAGTYELTASKGTGYISKILQATAVAGQTMNLPEIQLRIPRGGISGVVQVEGGGVNELRAVRVDFLSPIYNTSMTPQDSGNFQVNDLPVGTYSVIVRLAGFEPTRQDGISVTVGNIESSGTLLLRRSVGDFLIDGGAPYSRDRTVDLKLDNSTAVDMRISEDPSFVDATLGDTSYVTYNSTPTFVLSPADGNKTVFVQYRDGASVGSEVFSSTVTLDQTPPSSAAVSINLGSTVTNADPALVTLSLQASDPTSGVTLVMVSSDPDFSDDTWMPYQQNLNYVLPGVPPAQGTHSVYVRFQDAAGNAMLVGNAVTDSIEYDTSAPSLIGITLNCNGVSGAQYCNSENVTISINPPTNEPTAAMAFSNTGGFGAVSFIPFSSTAAWRLQPGAGLKTVYIQLRDEAGNLTNGTDNDTIVLDDIPPTVSLGLSGIGLGGPSTSLIRDGTAVTLTMNGTDDNTAKTNLVMQISNYPDFSDGSGSPVAWVTYADVTNGLSVLNPGISGTKYIYVRIKDLAGNITPSIAQIVLDAEDPQLFSAGFSQGSISNSVAVQLNTSYVGATELRFQGPLIANGTWQSAAPSLDITLTGPDGPKLITVSGRDASGRVTILASDAAITLDRQSPTGSSVSIVGTTLAGTSTSLTGSTEVTLQLSAAGATWMKISNFSGLADAAWQPYTTSPIAWQLLVGDSLNKSVYAQFKDDAGNETTTPTQGTIELDTTAPPPGTLSIGGGALFTNIATVSLAVGSAESTWSVRLLGDIAQAGTYDSAAYPTSVTLQGAEGIKFVSAVIIDAAGNAASATTKQVTLDTTAPAAGIVLLADGQATVNDRRILVSVSQTNPNTMMFWEVAPFASCGAPACTDVGFEPFSASSNFTLSTGKGPKNVCWRFCDEAGNASTVGTDSLLLDNYLTRPRPELVSISPASVRVFDSTGDLTVSGRGIAWDTQVQIGAFLLDCTSFGSFDCQADALPFGDGCDNAGDLCETTCATSCTASLPPSILNNGGSYQVRLVTPAPELSGLGFSAEVLFLSMTSPVPRVLNISPRGMTLNAPSSPPSVDVDIWGYDLVETAQYRLGNTFGQILLNDEVSVDGAPFAANGQRHVRVRFDTANFITSDLNDIMLIVVNPSPGGGESLGRPFGINPPTLTCPINGSCSSNLRWTRAAHPNRPGVYQSYRTLGDKRFGGLIWTGGTAATLLGGGQIQRRFTAQHSAGALPLPLVGLDSLRLEDERGDMPLVFLETAAARGAGLEPTASLTLNVTNIVTGLQTADLNRDGYPDMVATAFENHTIEVLLSDGSGGFSSPVSYYSGLNPSDVALGDLNGDGVTDMVSADFGQNALSVWYGMGDGTFGNRFEEEGATQDRHVQIADLNADGAPDLVVASATFPCIKLGTGMGLFRPMACVSWSGNIDVLRVADVNGDGNADLVTIDLIGNVLRTATGLGDGTFNAAQTVTTGNGPYSLELADFNNDGALDVVYGHIYETKIGVRLNQGDGTWMAQSDWIPAGPGSNLAVGDLSGDGNMDFVVSVNILNDIQIFPGDGTGSFGTALPLTSSRDSSVLAVTDVNLDGSLDLVSAGEIGFKTLAINYGVVGAHFGVMDALDEGHFVQKVVALDGNRDGVVDLLVGGDNTNALSFYAGNADGTFAAAIESNVGSPQYELIAADINGDGIADALVGNYQTNSFYYLLGDGSGGFGPAVSLDMNPGVSGIAAGDLDNDGDQDIVVANDQGATSTVTWRLNLGAGSFSAKNTIAVDERPYEVALGDMDNDGDLDIATANAKTLLYESTVSIILNTGAGSFAAAVDYPVDASGQPVESQSLVLEDMNGNGVLDVVVARRQGGGVTIIPGTGSGTLNIAGRIKLTGGVYPGEVNVGDINGDGFPDILLSSDGDDTIVFWMGAANGVYDGPYARSIGDGAQAIEIADVDADGTSDVLIGHINGGETRIWRMPGPGTWTQELRDPAGFDDGSGPVASLNLPPGDTLFTLSQGPQRVDSLALKIRISGTALNALTLFLDPPRSSDTELLIDNGSTWSAASVWQAVYRDGDPVVLSSFNGWQPKGVWTIRINNSGAAVALLEDVAITTHGAFSVRRTGYDASNPIVLNFPSGDQNFWYRATTLGNVDTVNLACADTGSGAPESWYEFTLGSANTVTISTTGDFDSVIEVSSGVCASRTPLQCDDNGNGGVNAKVNALSLSAAGVYCVVIDGKRNGGIIHSGTTWLNLSFLSPPG